MKIALAQIQITDNMEENYHKALNCIKEAAVNGTELICFPEVQLSPIFPQYEKFDASHFLLPLSHPYVKGIQAACQKNGIYASPNFYIDDGKAYDMSLLIDDKGVILGRQKMVHIAQCKC